MLVRRLAFQLELRATSYNDPWNWFDPLLVTALICRPAERAYSAWYVDVTTFTSDSDSMLTRTAGRLIPGSIADPPSTMKSDPPPPPMRAAGSRAPGVTTTPGASPSNDSKVRLAAGRCLTAS